MVGLIIFGILGCVIISVIDLIAVKDIIDSSRK